MHASVIMVCVSRRDDAALVQRYLATLDQASPSTRRQRAWALGELLTHAGEQLPGAPLLGPAAVTSWVDTAAAEPRPASLPGLRARASAARALARYAEATGAAPPGTWDAIAAALRLPAPAPTPRTKHDRVRHLLTRAHPDLSPGGVLPAVWARFCAHTHLLALTGAREDVMAGLDLHAVTAATTTPAAPVTPNTPAAQATPTTPGTAVRTTDLAGEHRVALPGPARLALGAWLQARAGVVAALRGTEPTALWVRVRPSTDHRSGSLRPAGLPLSDRGLRLSFTTTLALIELSEPAVRDLTVADVRGYGRRATDTTHTAPGP